MNYVLTNTYSDDKHKSNDSGYVTVNTVALPDSTNPKTDWMVSQQQMEEITGTI